MIAVLRLSIRFALGPAVWILIIAGLASPALAQSDLQALDRRMTQYAAKGNYAAALAEALKLEVALKARFGTDNENYAGIQNNLAFLHASLGQYEQAEALYKQALTWREQKLGSNDIQVARSLDTLAKLYVDQGKAATAEPLMRRALAIADKTLPSSDPFAAKLLNDLAVVVEQQGKFLEAEGLYRRAIKILEFMKGPNNVEVARAVGNLAVVNQHLGRLEESGLLHRRALPILEKSLGKNHPDVATALANMAGLLQALNRDKEAEEVLKRTLAIREKTFGPTHPDVAHSLSELASVQDNLGRTDEAESLRRRALAIFEKVHGSDHPDVANELNNLSVAAALRKQYGEAEVLLRRSLPPMESVLGASHPKVTSGLSNLAYVLSLQGRFDDALPPARKATKALSARAADEAPTLKRGGQDSRIVEDSAGAYRVHLMALGGLARKGGFTRELGQEAYEIAQGASQSSASAALQQMANRFAAGGGELAQLIRLNQDALTLQRDVEKTLIAIMSSRERQKERPKFEAMRQQAETQLISIAADIERIFPDYLALTRPKPLTIAETQRTLNADEALIVIQTGETESYVFGVTREAFGWAVIPLDAKAITARVTAFRRGLNVDDLTRAIEVKGEKRLFDLAGANELYRTLIGPVETLTKGKRELLVVPSGALTALPFHLLITDIPRAVSGSNADAASLASYRDAAWLLKRHAVTVLPSVASVKALRVFARKERAAKPMIGYGDPVFNAEREGGSRNVKRAAVKTRAYTDFWQGAGIDRAKLGEALPRLEDTADELKAIAQKIGAAASDIYLRQAASETAVKAASLSDYRIVYFATHGLIAGDVKGLAEPSLALTIPRAPDDRDDGLLTASEIAQLKLNADWVVLSACNTIAGDKPGAEALSGLARSFFYAGARSLLVTHWAVDSAAATQLTTSTFDIIASDRTIGRSEALRRAMLTYLNDSSNQINAYPAYWGAFSLIGDGGR